MLLATAEPESTHEDITDSKPSLLFRALQRRVNGAATSKSNGMPSERDQLKSRVGNDLAKRKQ
jgi:hypothetical protein